MKLPKMKIPIRGFVVILGVVVVIESFVLYKSFYILPPDTFSASADYVRARGSWIADTVGGIHSDFPLNTTEIVCYRDRGVCIESRAYIQS